MVSFEKLAAAIMAFIEAEIIPSMTSGQELAARFLLAWLMDSGNVTVELLSQNSIAKTFGFVDSKKNINADRALKYLRSIAERKKWEFTLPIFGRFAFGPEDIDKIQGLLKEV